MTEEEQRHRINASLLHWLTTLAADQRWCLLISADPDAMGAAEAMRRILKDHVLCADVYRINTVTRPDNLAMIRGLDLKIKEWDPEKIRQYDHFALLDSQPGHSPLFSAIPFDVVIDHHPLGKTTPVKTPVLQDIRPSYGAASSILTEYLRILHIRPSAHLATALILGIRTDTETFLRSGIDADYVAYHWLSRVADLQLVRTISRSSFLKSWLPWFHAALDHLRECSTGTFCWLGEVPDTDLLVAIADFLSRVHGMRWIAVSGKTQKAVTVIFRGDGSRDIGRLADACFHDVGSAGGHRCLARAEIPLQAVPADNETEEFLFRRLSTRRVRPQTRRSEPARTQEAVPQTDTKDTAPAD